MPTVGTKRPFEHAEVPDVVKSLTTFAVVKSIDVVVDPKLDAAEAEALETAAKRRKGRTTKLSAVPATTTAAAPTAAVPVAVKNDVAEVQEALNVLAAALGGGGDGSFDDLDHSDYDDLFTGLDLDSEDGDSSDSDSDDDDDETTAAPEPKPAATTPVVATAARPAAVAQAGVRRVLKPTKLASAPEGDKPRAFAPAAVTKKAKKSNKSGKKGAKKDYVEELKAEVAALLVKQTLITSFMGKGLDAAAASRAADAQLARMRAADALAETAPASAAAAEAAADDAAAQRTAAVAAFLRGRDTAGSAATSSSSASWASTACEDVASATCVDDAERVELVLPIEPYRAGASPTGRVVGAAALAADTDSLRVMMNRVGAAARDRAEAAAQRVGGKPLNGAAIVSARVELEHSVDELELVVSPDGRSVMGEFALRTVGLVSLGLGDEIVVDGMLRASFAPSSSHRNGRMQRIELTFDSLAFRTQLAERGLLA